MDDIDSRMRTTFIHTHSRLTFTSVIRYLTQEQETLASLSERSEFVVNNYHNILTRLKYVQNLKFYSYFYICTGIITFSICEVIF